MTAYNIKPARFLRRIHSVTTQSRQRIYCAHFEAGTWRALQLAKHLIKWLPDYALLEQDLIDFDHGNAVAKLEQAAARVYTSQLYSKRGEVGEIALHAICRDHFSTIPISPRVFYKSASNDVIKAFDMVHVRYSSKGSPKIWLGESKIYENRADATGDAIKSIKEHIDSGFLTNEKILIGPQIPRNTPNYEKVVAIFDSMKSNEEFIKSCVFVIGIFADSPSAAEAKDSTNEYREGVKAELEKIIEKILASPISHLNIVLIYIPLGSKKRLMDEFDKKLKALQ